MKIVVIPISMDPIISIISLIALNLQENQQQIWHQTYANIVPVTAQNMSIRGRKCLNVFITSWVLFLYI